ncbi:Treh [Ramazzottius varieornatus]|uniref:Trehalase n=1 Tax=Ramazzottius varieornatus TaxID=947166 RepID=A0A1D1W1J1_RAMVA|nr:Treh [Ramazzottius varieornatus]
MSISDGVDQSHRITDPIFCYGSLLETAQLLEIHHDSKTFVDRPLKEHVTVEEVLQAFDQLEAAMRGNITQQVMKDFVNGWFAPVGASLEPYLPPDWKPVDQGGLPLYNVLENPLLKQFAKDIHEQWHKLGRKIRGRMTKLTGQNSPANKTESLMYVPHPFIVPGGRFQEMYYWDSYWTIQGLLASGMKETVANMLRNFAYLIQTVGHMPNANRVYYEQRSQPPFFALMVETYRKHSSVQASESLAFIRELLPALEVEQEFFRTQRSEQVTKNGLTYTLNVYRGGMTHPRPEAYFEDYHLAETLDGFQTEEELFANLAAGAESGWDFSSRWYEHAAAHFSTIRTETIIPVDLNAILCASERLMGDFYYLTGNITQAEVFRDRAVKRADAIHDLMWNDHKKMWRDYDAKYQLQRDGFYTSHITPLFAKCNGKVNITSTAFLQAVLSSVDIKEVTAFPGGFPQSLVREPFSGQQWDFPYAWPPNQLMMIESFMDDPATRETARQWAQKWMDVVYIGFVKSGSFYEKYDAREMGMYGGGGEYDVQEGFGWTNGGILRLMEIFPNQLVANPPPDNSTFLPPSSSTDGEVTGSSTNASADATTPSCADKSSTSSLFFIAFISFFLL